MPRGETWGTKEVCDCGRVVPWRMAFCVECDQGATDEERAAVFAERAALRTGAGVPFLVESSSTGYGWAIAGPDGSTDGWGSYPSESEAVWNEGALTRAYEAGVRASTGESADEDEREEQGRCSTPKRDASQTRP